jgi:hypothetical protein
VCHLPRGHAAHLCMHTQLLLCHLLLLSCRALYHCNYCHKDISDNVRIKCADCPDFDLCVECFCVGVETNVHSNSHSCRVMDNLSFPIFHPSWGVSAFAGRSLYLTTGEAAALLLLLAGAAAPIVVAVEAPASVM